MLGADIPRGLPGVIASRGLDRWRRPRCSRGFTGRRNLQILARIDGIGRSAVDDVLGRVRIG